MSARRDRIGPLTLVVGLVAVMAVAATAGLHGVFGSWRVLVPATIGALGASAACAIAARFRLLIGEAVAASAVGFVLVGIVTCGGPRGFFTGLTDGWADVLSSTPPADLTAALRAVPFALAWIGVLLGGEIARHARQPALPALGPLVTLGLAALLSGPGRNIALVQGAIVAAGALGVAVVQQRSLRAAEESGRGRLVFAGRAVAMLAVIAVAAPFVGQRLPLAEAHERYDLRDQVQPPWDPLSVPSPLVQLKASLKQNRVDDVMFTVRSDEPLTRWNLAVLGSYDGVVWTVGSGQSPAADEFRTVGTNLPNPPDGAVDGDAPTAAATVTIDALDGPWVPTPGWTRQLSITSDGPDTDVRENLRTGTVAITTGLPEGLSYDVEARLPSAASDAELTAADVELLPPAADLDVLPPSVRNLTADLVEGIDPGWGQVAALRDDFRTTGFYDSTELVPPGHSYFRIAEFLADPDRIVGYEEQYAAAAAVMARAARLPTRVVVGYTFGSDRYVDGVAEVRAGDIAAWIEVLVDGHGWVPVDVTPDRSRVPTTDQQGTSFEDIAVPNPPPPPLPPPDVQVVTDEEEQEADEPDKDEQDDEEVASTGGIGWGGWTAIGAGALGGLVLLLAGVVLVLKARRTRRRRNAERAALRIAGAWHEVTDRYTEAKVPAPTGATPLEAARSYLHSEPSATDVRTEMLGLVAVVDRAAYDADEPDDDDADRAWQYCRSVVGALDAGRSPWQRLRMRLDPRPLLRRRRPTAVRPGR
jgi:transglutaminase-like putative cysteine protease